LDRAGGVVPGTRTRGSLLREPLVHFLLLGAALFALDAWLRPAADAGGGEIVVSEARVRSLAQNFRRTWQRPPTRVELDGLVREHVREEVLYREALALGLDRDDTVVRRRLRQKMEFIADEAAALGKPTDAELAGYLAAHPDAFRTEPRATFSQVYLDPRRRAKTLDADAARLLAELNRGGAAAAPAKASDSLLLLEPRYENAARADVARTFGDAFAAALFAQPAGRWVGPLASGYGVHLVRVEAMKPGGVAPLEDVRPLVEREWANARRKALGEAFYDKLRAKYKVTVRMPGGEGGEAKP
jgi:hypothetical protein